MDLSVVINLRFSILRSELDRAGVLHEPGGAVWRKMGAVYLTHNNSYTLSFFPLAF